MIDPPAEPDDPRAGGRGGGRTGSKPGPARTRTPRPGTILQGGRQKAYRPLPQAERRRAYEAGVAAYARGDFFEAHEILEPAWMGADDLAERELYQGLIKLAAAFVHGVRGNPLGIARNLAGARERLSAAVGSGAAHDSGLDLDVIVAAIDDRLAKLAADPTTTTIEPPQLTASATSQR